MAVAVVVNVAGCSPRCIAQFNGIGLLLLDFRRRGLWRGGRIVKGGRPRDSANIGDHGCLYRQNPVGVENYW